MNIIEAIFLGVIQGFTEFLPISSSGHIEIGSNLLETDLLTNLEFVVMTHLATTIVTIIVFRQEIWEITSGTLKYIYSKYSGKRKHKEKDRQDFQMSILIVVATIPLLILEILFGGHIAKLFTGNIDLVGAMLILTSIILLITAKHPNYNKKSKKEINISKAFQIGIAQAFAILPGISRSGSTISVGLMLGVDREKAARFSFLMIIPPTIAFSILKIAQMSQESYSLQIEPHVLLVGFIASLLTGYISLRFMINIVKNAKLHYFAGYTALVGVLVLVIGL